MHLFYSVFSDVSNGFDRMPVEKRGPDRDPWRGAELGQGDHQLSEASAVCVRAVQVLLSVCVQGIQPWNRSISAVGYITTVIPNLPADVHNKHDFVSSIGTVRTAITGMKDTRQKFAVVWGESRFLKVSYTSSNTSSLTTHICNKS